MKAISVKQPWANMIASGVKTIEVRTWSTKHRGPILIVSSLRPNIPPAGAAVAVADLVDCRPMEQQDAEHACCPFQLGAYAWQLTGIRPLEPFPVSGRLGLYEVAVEQDSLRPLDPASAAGRHAAAGGDDTALRQPPPLCQAGCAP